MPPARYPLEAWMTRWLTAQECGNIAGTVQCLFMASHIAPVQTKSVRYLVHGIHPRRIDPFAALANAGVVVFRRSLGRLAGAYIAANPSDGSAPGVLIHAGHPLSKQRYTAAHELCHHRRDHATIFDEDTEWLTRGDDRQSDRERIAEAFAAWFLMPPALVTQVITQLGLRTSGEDLCEEFLHWGAKQRDGLPRTVEGTTLAAAARTLADLGQPPEHHWPYDEARDYRAAT